MEALISKGKTAAPKLAHARGGRHVRDLLAMNHTPGTQLDGRLLATFADVEEAGMRAAPMRRRVPGLSPDVPSDLAASVRPTGGNWMRQPVDGARLAG